MSGLPADWRHQGGGAERPASRDTFGFFIEVSVVAMATTISKFIDSF